MPNITDSVGAGGRNAAHDVAIVQLMLKVLKDSNGRSYLSGAYTDPVGPHTAQAIKVFQGLPGGTTAGGEMVGLVRPGGATWQRLLAAFVSAAGGLRTARTTPGVGLAYLAASEQQLGQSLSKLAAGGLVQEFRSKVTQLIRTVLNQAGIVWALVPDTGGWRPFDKQGHVVTKAGIGESVHNYGYAADLTVAGLSWITPDLHVHPASIGFGSMKKADTEQFYAARDRVATGLKLFRTKTPGDFGHLQNFDDYTLDSASSFMALLHAAGPRRMNWTPQFQKPTNYLCDLGLGGDLYYVGTSGRISNLDPSMRISAADLAKALTAKKKADPKFSPDSFLGRSGKPLSSPLTASDIEESDIKAVQRMLKVEFEAAASNWKKWQPVLYSSAGPRPDNPDKRY
jgi:hypothetical protein